MITAERAAPQVVPRQPGTGRDRWPVVAAALALATTAAFLLYLTVGDRTVPPDRVVRAILGQPETRLDRVAVWEVRLPRALLATGAGAMLGMAGSLLQAILRNPLASPDLTGVSSGAVAAAVAWLSFGGPGPGNIDLAVPLVAAAGGFGAMVLVYALSRRLGRTDGVELILTGVVVGGVLGGVTTVSLLMADPDDDRLLGWVIGSLSLRGWPEVRVLAPYALVAVPLLVLAVPAANLLQLGDDAATGLGLIAERGRLLTLVAAVVMTAAAVSVAGAIGFLGLVAPHVARLLVGGDARRLVPASGLLGATLLLLADLLARTFRLTWFPGVENLDVGTFALPVGIFTTLLGAPLFLAMLLRGQR